MKTARLTALNIVTAIVGGLLVLGIVTFTSRQDKLCEVIYTFVYVQDQQVGKPGSSGYDLLRKLPPAKRRRAIEQAHADSAVLLEKLSYCKPDNLPEAARDVQRRNAAPRRARRKAQRLAARAPAPAPAPARGSPGAPGAPGARGSPGPMATRPPATINEPAHRFPPPARTGTKPAPAPPPPPPASVTTPAPEHGPPPTVLERLCGRLDRVGHFC